MGAYGTHTSLYQQQTVGPFSMPRWVPFQCRLPNMSGGPFKLMEFGPKEHYPTRLTAAFIESAVSVLFGDRCNLASVGSRFDWSILSRFAAYVVMGVNTDAVFNCNAEQFRKLVKQ